MIVDCNPLDLEDYKDVVNLGKKFKKTQHVLKTQKEKEAVIDKLLEYLIGETNSKKWKNLVSSLYTEKRDHLYSLLTVHPPTKFPGWVYQNMNQLLQTELLEQTIVNGTKLPLISQTIPETEFSSASKTALWKGDITKLKIDAIVNAASKELLGCFQPFHNCIDNAIHTAAGPQLREDCSRIINKQGCLEGTGWAKVTKAYNLPSKYVLHTVGPIIKRNQEIITVDQENLLADCYYSCLTLASRIEDIRSIAFCSISTGIYGFPIKAAAAIALNTVEKWIEKNPETLDLIVFNVFSEDDYKTYENVLRFINKNQTTTDNYQFS